ncbi:MAG: hypothetical protein J5767_14610 [Paludibacteraceae bacterium]|nr:hypothetical protein [Paludibacteraceae bacterium]
MTNFSFNEKVAILSLASGIMFADDKAKMSERSSFEKIQKKLDLTIPVSLLTVEEAVKKVSKFDKLTKLRILLTIQSVAITDNQFNHHERKMTNEIAEKLGISFDLPKESAEMVIELLYKFAALDGVVPNEEKNLLIKLLGGDESAYNHIAQDANSFNLEDAIAQISIMKEAEKSFVGFYLQQIISADETINDEESTLIKKVFESTGIDNLCVPEKTGFWKRIFG